MCTLKHRFVRMSWASGMAMSLTQAENVQDLDSNEKILIKRDVVHTKQYECKHAPITMNITL